MLRANAAYLEPHANMDGTATALAGELRLMAAWLGLASVEAGAGGNLSRALKKAL